MIKLLAVCFMLAGVYVLFGYLGATFPSLAHTAFMAGSTAVTYGYVLGGLGLGFVLYVGKKVK